MKPHIKFTNGHWVCKEQGKSYAGFGVTPWDAYIHYLTAKAAADRI